MNYFTDVLRDKYAEFTGRARRQEYWMFALIVFGINFVISIVGMLFQDTPLYMLFTILSSLFSLAIFVPSLALNVRRLHDIGKDWGWIFIVLIPIAGPIWYLVLMATDSQPGQNQFGPNPKGF